jgi:hypothetical protein
VKRVHEALAYYEDYTSLKFRFVEIADNCNFDEESNREKWQLRISFGPPVDRENEHGEYERIWGWSFCGTHILSGQYNPEVDNMGGEKWTTTYFGGQPWNQAEVEKMTPRDVVVADYTLFHELGHVLGLEHEADGPRSLVEGQTLDSYLVATSVSRLSNVFRHPDLPHSSTQKVSCFTKIFHTWTKTMVTS